MINKPAWATLTAMAAALFTVSAFAQEAALDPLADTTSGNSAGAAAISVGVSAPTTSVAVDVTAPAGGAPAVDMSTPDAGDHPDRQDFEVGAPEVEHADMEAPEAPEVEAPEVEVPEVEVPEVEVPEVEVPEVEVPEVAVPEVNFG